MRLSFTSGRILAQFSRVYGRVLLFVKCFYTSRPGAFLEIFMTLVERIYYSQNKLAIECLRCIQEYREAHAFNRNASAFRNLVV